ncbi:cytochrome P450 [Bailinhaonella thermotolerans]|nr:cytochrome P450 [Bailinhaonella thermotolerans]
MNTDLPYFPFQHRNDSLAPECQRLQETQPIARVRMDTLEAWLITGYSLAKQALTDDRLSLSLVSRPETPKLPAPGIPIEALASMDALGRAGLRKAFTSLLTPAHVARAEPRARDIARSLLDRMAGSPQPLDLYGHYAQAFPLALSGHLLGMPLEELQPLAEATETALSLEPRRPIEYQRNWESTRDYFVALLERPDLPDGVARRFRDENAARPAEDRLDAASLADKLVMVFGSSHLGSASMLSLSFVTLLHRRDVWEELRRDPSRTEGVVEECLRFGLFLPAGLPRVAREDLDLGGVTISAGELVLIAADVANRDPAAYPDPGRFDPGRETKGHLAFGLGPAFCPGSALARMTMKVAIEELVRRFPAMRLAVPPDRVTWRDDLIEVRPVEIPVRW